MLLLFSITRFINNIPRNTFEFTFSSNVIKQENAFKKLLVCQFPRDKWVKTTVGIITTWLKKLVIQPERCVPLPTTSYCITISSYIKMPNYRGSYNVATTTTLPFRIRTSSYAIWLTILSVSSVLVSNKTASFQKEAMRTQVALYFFYEVKFV